MESLVGDVDQTALSVAQWLGIEAILRAVCIRVRLELESLVDSSVPRLGAGASRCNAIPLLQVSGVEVVAELGLVGGPLRQFQALLRVFHADLAVHEVELATKGNRLLVVAVAE